MDASYSDSGISSRRPSSPFAKERVLQGQSDDEDERIQEEGEEDEGEDHDDGILTESDEADSTHTDDGYEEDEEDGTFSDDEDYAANIPRGPTSSDFPFARSTNYRKRRQTTLPSAPVILPPPNRRGRDHIKVPETVEQKATCSRHCSPPPRSRSGSNGNMSRMSRSPSRLSDAGPRANRAGSPMPSRVDSSEEDDPESLIRTEAPVFEDRESSSVTDGVRDFFRRASEHIPGFGMSAGLTRSGTADAVEDRSNPVVLSRARSLNSKVTFQANAPRRERSTFSREVQPIRCPARREVETGT
jgi:hypothetical protein